MQTIDDLLNHEGGDDDYDNDSGGDSDDYGGDDDDYGGDEGDDDNRAIKPLSHSPVCRSLLAGSWVVYFYLSL